MLHGKRWAGLAAISGNKDHEFGVRGILFPTANAALGSALDPIAFDEFRDTLALYIADGLDKEGLSTQLVGFFDIGGVPGRGQHDYGKRREAGRFGDMFENFHTRDNRQIEVEQHEGRRRELAAVGVIAFAGKVIQGFLPVADGGDGAGQFRFFERVLEQEHVIRIIFNQENATASGHCYAF
jgi:hypothetical protein